MSNKIKVYFKEPHGLSRAMARVTNALRRHLPDGCVEVASEDLAEHVVLHVIGAEGIHDKLSALSKPYSIIQYCVKSTTMTPAQWLPIWRDAEAVWSYYDLNALLEEDFYDVRDKIGHAPQLDNFYYAPLGVDMSFREWPDTRRYIAAMTGYVAESECLDQVAAAAANFVMREHGRFNIFHLGPSNLNLGSHVKSLLHVNDDVVAQEFSRAQYVTGLRKVEGFELPLIEGYICGAHPVTFALPCYQKWFTCLDAVFLNPEGDVFKQLGALFSRTPVNERLTPPAEARRAIVRQNFNWDVIAPGFWYAALARRTKDVMAPTTIKGQQVDMTEANARGITAETVSVQARRPRLLWVGDACVNTGFGVATHGILHGLTAEWNIAVLGLHYRGDPYKAPYPVYPTVSHAGGDFWGIRRLPDLCEQLSPDVVIIQQDPWNVFQYTDYLKKECERREIPLPKLVGNIAVDGKNCKGYAMNDLDHANFWTEFGRQEAILGGFKNATSVIPLGVELKNFGPLDRNLSREYMGLPEIFPNLTRRDEAFIVGYVGRNQPRKRLDLLLFAFAEFAKDKPEAHLFIHCAPTGEDTIDIKQLSSYLGVGDRVILSEPPIGMGSKLESLRATYCCMNVHATTTQGEGWGLTTYESMACGIPNVHPAWASLSEVPDTVCLPVPVRSHACTMNSGVNVIGGLVDPKEFAEYLTTLYRNPSSAAEIGAAGRAYVNQWPFRWESISTAWSDMLRKVIAPETVEVVGA